MSSTQVLTQSPSRASNDLREAGSERRSSTPGISAAPNPTTSGAPLLEDEYQDRRKLKLGFRLADTIRHYWHLGFTAFGGPGVHVVILRKRFVEKLAWLDETTFADLFSLGNALPGPGSTQLAFSIAVARNGTLAGLVAFLFWSIPGAAGMAALGAGVRKFPERLPPTVLGLLTGLNAAAVGLVALAAFQLSKSSITDGVSRLLVLGSASFGICYHAPWMYPVLVFGGGFTTLLYDFRLRIIAGVSAKLNIREARTRSNNAVDGAQNDSTQDIELEQVNTAQRASLDKARTPASVQELPFQVGSSLAQGSLRQRNAQTVDRTRTGTNQSTEGIDAAIVDRRTPIMVLNRYFAIGLGAFFLTFVVAIVLTRSQLHNPPRAFDFFTNMMIAGVIIFGGGPVVIPLLRGYTVENGWVDSRDFLLGFAILQAFPGPNFNFAAYLGVLSVPSNPALGAFIGWLGIFSPGILLKLSLLPIYNTWRKHEVAKSVLRGLNASATGLVYTAVWQLFLVGYIYTPARGAVVEATSQSGPLTSDPFWGVVASSAFVATQWFKSPPAVTIVAGAVAGLAWFGVVGAADTERQQAFF
ncbi:related to chromate transport protein [Ustilago bromivora]|uniref:Related to chromate transport protein n=1 Tax=Ustilago bromivora TaxID=307758 RepID=A0A1K0H957_9BASI|nr:related to chromate transport protein [Ustilago bromivora]SYW75500.1 related to chromate transport protein [Ustilago bromivora]